MLRILLSQLGLSAFAGVLLKVVLGHKLWWLLYLASELLMLAHSIRSSLVELPSALKR
jgi:hypothetical protein